MIHTVHVYTFCFWFWFLFGGLYFFLIVCIPQKKPKDIEIYHSAHVQEIDSFEGKNVIVVGNCTSGSDVCSLAVINKAKNVYNVMRQPRFVINLWQTVNNNKGEDEADVEGDFYIDTTLSARGIDFDPLLHEINLNAYNHQTPRLENGEVDFSKGVTFSQGWHSFVEQGLVQIINGQIDYETLLHSNGQTKHVSINPNKNDNSECGCKLSDIDMIIFATGYDSLESIADIFSEKYKQESQILTKFQQPNMSKFKNLLYLLTFIPGYKNDQIAINGGNIFQNVMMYEMQSRLIAGVWAINHKPFAWVYAVEPYKLVICAQRFAVGAIRRHPCNRIQS
jgi:hypothetical protein